MQKATKYRLTIAALGLAVIGLTTYVALQHRADAQLHDQAAADKRHAAESESKFEQAKRALDGFKAEAVDRTTRYSTMQQAVAAFSRQAEACQAIKQQFHVQE